ncbi:PAS domain S-box-containing protein [Rhodobium gokarnense]|uniref:histidine kinase n=1 Tax=Rhodobium gokarnense TaxID=364296 RepID=A0ABT3HGV3_9HYPH|nr:PAS domain S-box-containing protein [Rhodobium gokarnense]
MRLLNQSLNGILLNIGSPLIVADRGLNIVHVSNASEELFQINTDEQLPHLSLLKRQKGFPDIVDLANQAMTERRRIETEIRGDDIDAIISIVPNTQESGQVSGAIILIADNTNELRRTRNELQLIFDNFPQAIFVRDRNGKIVKANPAACAMVGAADRDVEGEDYYGLLGEADAEAAAALDRRFLEGGHSLEENIGRMTFANGEARWVRVTHVRSRDSETGEPLIYGLKEDVTSEQEALKAVQRSEERLALATDASGIGLWDHNLETSTVWWSDRFKNLLGIDDKDFTGDLDAFTTRLHPEDADRIMEAMRQHLEDGVPYEEVYRLRRADGTYLWVEARGEASRDADGKAVRMTGTIDDITERNRTLLELRERNGLLQQAARMSGLGFWRIDLLDDSLFWSEQIYAVHDVTPETFSPTLEAAMAFYHPDDVDHVRALVDKARNDKQSFEYEARIVRPSGEVRRVKSVGEVDVDPSRNTTSVFGIFLDVTEVREREADLRAALAALSESNEELNRFSYVCSHDMKEPVRLIAAMCDLLQEPEVQGDAGERTELIARIGSNTRRLSDIISSLLAYSRIDQKVEHIDVDLNQVVSDIQEGLELGIAESGAKVVAGDLPVVSGARVHFTQLFQNLIANAIKFNGTPAPEIRISAEVGASTVTIRVEDNGPGIPEDAREEVFVVFRRLQRREEVEGTGLGLSICQRIVHQYGGTIIVEDSTALGGACFVISLPKAELKP